MEQTNIQGVFAVKVRPNQSKTQLRSIDLERKTLRVDVAAPPDKNKANIELVKFLRRHFGRPVTLLRGAKSREKQVRFL